MDYLPFGPWEARISSALGYSAVSSGLVIFSRFYVQLKRAIGRVGDKFRWIASRDKARVRCFPNDAARTYASPRRRYLYHRLIYDGNVFRDPRLRARQRKGKTLPLNIAVINGRRSPANIKRRESNGRRNRSNGKGYEYRRSNSHGHLRSRYCLPRVVISRLRRGRNPPRCQGTRLGEKPCS